MISNLRTALCARLEPSDMVDWLHEQYLPEIQRRLNSLDSRRRLALFGGEKIPTNERNLTDSRNRVGLILEYELARHSNDLLKEAGIEDLFWSYVVANRFPDLEVHDAEGNANLRFEVKSLQSCAEEKSANFATLIKDIKPTTDYLIVFLWEWENGVSSSWDQAVRILKMYAFHAYSLAKLRDSCWLNSPPNNCDYYQGFDLRYPVNCNGTTFSEEEHNLGKLLRLWKPDTEYYGADVALVKKTISAYSSFVAEVYELGFETIAHSLLSELAKERPENIEFGFVAGSIGVFSKLAPSSVGQRKERAEEAGLSHAIYLTDKYRCSGYSYDCVRGETKLFGDKKPKQVVYEFSRIT